MRFVIILVAIADEAGAWILLNLLVIGARYYSAKALLQTVDGAKALLQTVDGAKALLQTNKFVVALQR